MELQSLGGEITRPAGVSEGGLNLRRASQILPLLSGEVEFPVNLRGLRV
jgi:hypothetical protein